MAIQGLEFDKPTLVNGGHEQKAIVNTASGKQPVNAPTVEDIKRIAKGEAEKAVDASNQEEKIATIQAADDTFVIDDITNLKKGEKVSLHVKNQTYTFLTSFGIGNVDEDETKIVINCTDTHMIMEDEFSFISKIEIVKDTKVCSFYNYESSYNEQYPHNNTKIEIYK